MEEQIAEQKRIFRDILKESLFPVLKNKIENHQILITKISDLQQELLQTSYQEKNKIDTLSVFINCNRELSQLLNTYFSSETSKNQEPLFFTYHNAVETHLQTIDEKIVRVQDKERYYAAETDKKSTKFRKTLKRRAFYFSKIPVKIGNVFRKSKKEIHFKNQNVAFRSVTDHYFQTELIHKLIPIISDLNKEISEITTKYWAVDQAIDQQINTYLKNENNFTINDSTSLSNIEVPSLKERITKLESSLNETFDTIFDSYNSELYKSGTFESFISENKQSDNKINSIEKIQKIENKWNNTHIVLKDDWDLDLEIFNIIFSTISFYEIAQTEIQNRHKKINAQLDLVNEYLIKSHKNLESAADDTQFKNAAQNEIHNIKKHFNKDLIKKTIVVVTSQDLSSVINQFDASLQQLLDNISSKRAIVQKPDYTSPFPVSVINYTSPYELINYESWPAFSKKINTSKVDLANRINNILETLGELGQVIEFNLDSALVLFDQPSEESDPKTVALEGFQRNLDKVSNLKTSINNFEKELHELLYPGVESFNKEIVELTETENIYNIRLIIAKAKSVEKSKAFKKKLVDTVKNFIPIIIAFSLNGWKRSNDFIQNIFKKYGLSETSGIITKEISNFLVEAEQSVHKLPFVYQRLFRSETLNNEELFEGRTEELETLNTAYNVWKKERFSTTLISGERGAGKTSLAHHFFKSQKKKPKIHLLSVTETLYESEQLWDFLNVSFSQNLHNLEEWVQYLNSNGKKIIILEDIEHLYCRKMNGFEALQLILELISLTDTSVFWVLTCSKYTCQYLDKSLQFSKQFSFYIEMKDSDGQTITNALVKRHKVSGYNLFFEEFPQAYAGKKFRKLSESEQQNFLEEEFFKDINKIAKNNFKIAFMYWLRSTTSVEGSTIKMRSLKHIDMSFLEELASDNLFILNLILIHEKLKLDFIIQLSGLEIREAKRIITILYEMGILICDENKSYSINTLLYRQVTTLLKSKNFIH